jgi:PBP1b-binding outer membrane lipoprotein LpoB
MILSLVLVAALLLAGCTSSSSSPEPITITTPESTAKPTTTTVTATVASQDYYNSRYANAGTPIKIRIDYNGEWRGAIAMGGNVKSVDGTGIQVFDIQNPGYAVSVNAQKMDGSSSRITVSILKNGKVIASEYTDSAYGVAMTSAAV